MSQANTRKYRVHIYREMRLVLEDIEGATPRKPR
jgi:hypothetical protein